MYRFRLVVVLLLTFTLNSFGGQGGKQRISNQEEIAQDISLAPCKDNERLEAVKSLFIRMGAQTENLIVERRDGVENLIIRIQGKSQETIVVGAHYDKVTEGCDAIDDWTGIVALAHIYKSLKDLTMQKNIIFVAFGKEEKGLYGSKAMVKAIKKEEVGQYCAMINIESLGMAAPQVPENLSSKALIDRVIELAQRMKIPFNKVTIPNVEADSLPFKAKKIPAITLSAVGDGWERVLHTMNDQVSKVNVTSVDLGYRLALALLSELDGLPCDVSKAETKTK